MTKIIYITKKLENKMKKEKKEINKQRTKLLQNINKKIKIEYIQLKN